MLRVVFRDPASKTLMEADWKVGQPSPFKAFPQTVWNVGEVRAIGPELEFIKVNMSGIPIANTASGEVVWYGDHAKFIAGNLP